MNTVQLTQLFKDTLAFIIGVKYEENMYDV